MGALCAWIQGSLERLALTLLVTTISAIVVLVVSVVLFAAYVTWTIESLCDDERIVRGMSRQIRVILDGMRLQVDRLESSLDQA